jgi:hypothetical protein
VSFDSSISSVETFAKRFPLNPLILFTFVTIEAKRFSELRVRLNRPRMLFDDCLMFKSFLTVEQEQTLRKLFLKFSERNAYKSGFSDELEYPRQPTKTKMTISTFVLQCSGGVVMRKICMTQ